MLDSLLDKLAIRGINAYQLNITRKNRAYEKEYLKSRQNQSHPDTKVHMLTCTNIEEFYLDFTAAARRQNNLIGIPLNYLSRKDAAGNIMQPEIPESKS